MTSSTAKGNRVGRIWTLAYHTFTQLVRMKVFYFLIIFAVIVIASNFLNLPQHMGPEAAESAVLRVIKNSSIGAMTLFSMVLAVVATGLLIPKDAEDRILYTILAKPVPRIDYLLGKLMGVLLLVFVSLVFMDLLMMAALHVRTSMLVAEQLEYAKSSGWSKESAEAWIEEIRHQGVTWELQGAVMAVFFRAAILAGMALLISTFSSSTLFTTVVTFLLFFIGFFQADARAVYLQGGEAGEGWFVRSVSLLLTMMLPDFQLFNVIDAVIEGQLFPSATFAKLALVSGYYLVFFTVASWFVFAEKEI